MDKEKEIEEMAKAIRARYSTDYCKNKNITSEIYKEVIKAQNEALELAIEDFKEHELKYLVEAGYRKADEVRKETAKEIWEDLLGIIDEGYHRPQVNTTISSPFMNGENCAYKVVIVRMKQVLKEKYGVEVDE